jgi:hypothetical protein
MFCDLDRNRIHQDENTHALIMQLLNLVEQLTADLRVLGVISNAFGMGSID